MVYTEKTRYCLSLFLLVLSAIFLLLAGKVYAFDGKTCYTIGTENAVSVKYGAPVDFFTSPKKTSIKIACDNKKVKVNVGNGHISQYIYKYGYRKINGKWNKIRFYGNKKKGSWYLGDASAVFTDNSKTGKGEVLAYICQKINGVWKCGCRDRECKKRKWQIQKYDLNLTYENEDTENDDKKCKVDGKSDIHYPSNYISYPGEKVILYGSGFETCAVSDVFWNGKKIESGLSSENGKELEITTPNVKPGRYEVYIEENGKKSYYSTIIWVGGDKNHTKPIITRISPETGKQGDTFTIFGNNFTDNNEIITTFGIISNLKSSSGGTKISFTYNPFDEKLKTYDKDSAEKIDYKMPVYVSVMNTNGQSNPFKFNLSI